MGVASRGGVLCFSLWIPPPGVKKLNFPGRWGWAIGIVFFPLDY
jgi:hypothetical protein